MATGFPGYAHLHGRTRGGRNVLTESRLRCHGEVAEAGRIYGTGLDHHDAMEHDGSVVSEGYRSVLSRKHVIPGSAEPARYARPARKLPGPGDGVVVDRDSEIRFVRRIPFHTYRPPHLHYPTLPEAWMPHREESGSMARKGDAPPSSLPARCNVSLLVFVSFPRYIFRNSYFRLSLRQMDIEIEGYPTIGRHLLSKPHAYNWRMLRRVAAAAAQYEYQSNNKTHNNTSRTQKPSEATKRNPHYFTASIFCRLLAIHIRTYGLYTAAPELGRTDLHAGRENQRPEQPDYSVHRG